MTMLSAAALAQAADIRAIRGERDRSNAAVAAHNFADMRPILRDDYTLLPGSLGTPVDVAQSEQRLTATFADPTFDRFERSPDEIVIAANRKRAAETGRWLGTWRKPDGTMKLSGIYQATWTPTDEGWKLLNESFVTLDCTGSKSCADYD